MKIAERLQLYSAKKRANVIISFKVSANMEILFLKRISPIYLYKRDRREKKRIGIELNKIYNT